MRLNTIQVDPQSRDASSSEDLKAASESTLAGLIVNHGSTAARNELVERNLGLVRAIAREFSQSGSRYDDLVAEGNMALIRAAERFDPDRGVKFGSYAAIWIRHAMRSARAASIRPVHVPARMLRELRQLAAARAELTTELDRAPTAAELAERTGMSRAHIRELEARADLLEPVRTIDPADCAATHAPSPADAAIGELDLEPTDSDRLRTLVARLPPPEREAISRCFGLTDAEPMTLRAVAQSMDLNAAAVRKLLRSGMVRLRSAVAA